MIPEPITGIIDGNPSEDEEAAEPVAHFTPTELGPRGKVFRDPVHGLIRISRKDGFLLDLINTPEFQRLRRIRQLGVSSLTYHGAEHTRFVHSMGVMNFAQRILETLGRRHGEDPDVKRLLEEHHRTIKAAALLHDVGHGPFSHLVERAFDTRKHHEAKTAEIITSPDYSVAEVLKAHGLEPDAVRSVIDKTFGYWWLTDIVSSQLDADRMDYLLRDTLMTGVEYGQYDAEWIVNNLCLAYDPDPNTVKSPEHWRLCLDKSRGLCSAEQLIVARMHMSLQVYYHRVTRGWEAHLLCLFTEAAEVAATAGLPEGTPPAMLEYFRNKGAVSADTFLQLDEALFYTGFQIWARAKKVHHARLAQLARAFLSRRKIFHCRPFPSKSADAMRVGIEMTKLGAENRFWLVDDNRFKGYTDFGSIYQSSKKDPGAVSTSAILLSDGSLEERAIPAEEAEHSLLLRPMGDSELPISWLYFDATLRDKVEKILSKR